MTATKPPTIYDATAKRWKAVCPHCGRVVARAKRESAAHNMLVHLAYEHGLVS